MKITCVYLEDIYENDPKSFHLNYFVESWNTDGLLILFGHFLLCLSSLLGERIMECNRVYKKISIDGNRIKNLI